MTFFAFFIPLIAACYWAGRQSTGYGIALFFFGVFIWQMAMDGPSSLLDHSGQCDYGHAANDC